MRYLREHGIEYDEVGNGSVISASQFNNLTTNQERQDAIWIYLTQELGIDPLHAAAIMGNIAVETGAVEGDFTIFSPNKVQRFAGDPVDLALNYNYDARDKRGYGLLQWTIDSRKEGLQNFANEIGGNIYDYDVQLQFIICEGTGNSAYKEYISVYSTFLTMTDLEEATKYFCEEFEKAGKAYMDRRITEANLIYDYYVKK